MDFQRLFDLFAYQLQRFPNAQALCGKEQGKWRPYATYECIQYIDQCSAVLLRLGLLPGEKIALLARHGQPLWTFLDLGAQQLGLVVVPIHATSGANEITYALQHAEVRWAFCDHLELWQLLTEAKPQCPRLMGVSTFQPLPGLDTPALSTQLVSPTVAETTFIQNQRDQIDPEAIATIIYTSGSSGTPKGVMLSHRNLVSNIKATITLIPITWEKKVLSFLPLSHIMERMVTYTCFAVGASVYYGQGHEQLADDLQEVRPHYFAAVPLIMERLYHRLYRGATRGPFWRKKIVDWAVGLGKKYNEKQRQFGFSLELLLANLVVFGPWRRALGGRIEGIMVGAAALHPELSRLFSAAGIPIREGYGLTETSPIVTFNRFEPGGVRFGTVGLPLPGVAVRIAAAQEDGTGEVQVQGPNVMMGYYRDPAATAMAWTEDGWFRTGDLGKWAYKNFLQLAGRQDNLFKTAAGKFIVPELIENHFEASRYIDRIMVTGNNRPYVSALILPAFEHLAEWCAENQIHWTAPQYMVLNPKVEQFFGRLVEETNAALAPYQQVKQFALLHEPWLAQTGELTPTLKLRRKAIAQKFAQHIQNLYHDPA